MCWPFWSSLQVAQQLYRQKELPAVFHPHGLFPSLACTSMVNWNPCDNLLFSWAQEVLCRHCLQVGKQFHFGALYYRGGNVHHLGYDCHATASLAFLLSRSSHKEGDKHIWLHHSFERARARNWRSAKSPNVACQLPHWVEQCKFRQCFPPRRMVYSSTAVPWRSVWCGSSRFWIG